MESGILATVTGTSSCAVNTAWNGSTCASTSTPTITTATPTSITQTTATGGGNTTSNGGATVTQAGLVWGTSANPTTASNLGITYNGWAIGGPWTSNITGLTASTTYHVRAYATNSAGTSYGNDVQFTASPLTPVDGVLGTACGRTYPYPSSSYAPYTQCAVGTPTNGGAFPAAGGPAASWQCQGLNGGATSGIC